MLQPSSLPWAHSIHIIDSSDRILHADPWQPFALDELLCQLAHQHQIAFCHIWRHANGFVLGQKDSHLPYAQQAMSWLERNGYQPMIRNSGGAAVPLDKDIINVSLIFPVQGNNYSNYNQDFHRMYELIAHAMAYTGKKVDIGEIQGAFCPGDYDLSVDGLKFCGIAQRRKLNAFAVQAFVIVDGKGSDRTRLVRAFYEHAAGHAPLTDYPQVTDESTESLQNLMQLGEGAVPKFVDQIKVTLEKLSAGGVLTVHDLQSKHIELPYQEWIANTATKLRQRYHLPM